MDRPRRGGNEDGSGRREEKVRLFPKAKDRPVVITALAARAAWLLTLDETDFQGKLGRTVYGLHIATPGEFLMEQRAQGAL